MNPGKKAVEGVQLDGAASSRTRGPTGKGDFPGTQPHSLIPKNKPGGQEGLQPEDFLSAVSRAGRGEKPWRWSSQPRGSGGLLALHTQSLQVTPCIRMSPVASPWPTLLMLEAAPSTLDTHLLAVYVKSKTDLGHPVLLPLWLPVLGMPQRRAIVTLHPMRYLPRTESAARLQGHPASQQDSSQGVSGLEGSIDS